MNDEQLKQEIKDHPEQLYKGNDTILGMMEHVEMYTVPSNKWCLELASKVKYSSISELINNAERIKEYCKRSI